MRKVYDNKEMSPAVSIIMDMISFGSSIPSAINFRFCSTHSLPKLRRNLVQASISFWYGYVLKSI